MVLRERKTLSQHYTLMAYRSLAMSDTSRESKLPEVVEFNASPEGCNISSQKMKLRLGFVVTVQEVTE